jgi:hypothetical protein
LLGLRVQAPERLVRLGSERIVAQQNLLAGDGLVQVLFGIGGVKRAQMRRARFVFGLQGLGGFIGVDGLIHQTQVLFVELAQLLKALEHRRLVVDLGRGFQAPLEHALHGFPIAALPLELDGFVQGLVEARLQLQNLLVQLERAIDVAGLARGDDRRGVQVLHLLLRIAHELRQAQHDLDQLVPVFFFAVELHQFGEQLAVVGAIFERSHEALGGGGPIVQLVAGDVADLEQELDALVAGRHVQMTGLDLDHLRPLGLALVDFRERDQRCRVAGVRVGGVFERLFGFVEVAGLP